MGHYAFPPPPLHLTGQEWQTLDLCPDWIEFTAVLLGYLCIHYFLATLCFIGCHFPPWSFILSLNRTPMKDPLLALFYRKTGALHVGGSVFPQPAHGGSSVACQSHHLPSLLGCFLPWPFYRASLSSSGAAGFGQVL